MIKGRSQLIKKLADELVYNYNDVLEKDFENHKGIRRQYADAPRYSIKNLLSGYATRLLRKKDKLH